MSFTNWPRVTQLYPARAAVAFDVEKPFHCATPWEGFFF